MSTHAVPTSVARTAGVLPVEVEAQMAQAIARLPAPLAGPCHRVAFAGGKRLRASLVLAAAAAAGDDGDPEALAACAAAVELLHCATLVHDDLMDAAPVRRGVPTISAQEGPGTALLAGDALIGAATRLAIQTGRTASLVLTDALAAMCAGQALEESFRYDPTLGEADAVAIIEGKAGSLLRAACLLGASVVTPDEDVAAALGAFGMAFGTSLQLVDDALDLLSSEPLCGKPVAADFFAGTVTMPAIAPLQGEPQLRALLRPRLTHAEREHALALLRGGTGIVSTVRRARDCAVQAHGRVSHLGGGRPAGATLARLPGVYVDRQLQVGVAPAYSHLLQGA